MCTGRVDPSFIFLAFKERTDGVIIIGCLPGECHYATEGNVHAYKMVLSMKRVMEFIGINPKRLRIDFVSSAEGIRFAEIMREFDEEIRRLGPLTKDGGMSEEDLLERLDTVLDLIPYIKLVLRQSLWIDVSGREITKLKSFMESEGANEFMERMILEKILSALLIRYLRKGILDPKEISKKLNIREAEVLSLLRELKKDGILLEREKLWMS